MFQNPFKHFNKFDIITSLTLLLLAVVKWLIFPYRDELKDFFGSWMTVFYVAIVVAFLNKIAYLLISHFKGDKLDDMWMGAQPKSAWKKAYLETIENPPKKNVWVGKLLDFWAISLVTSLFLMFIAAAAFLIFSNLIYHFFVYLIVFDIINYFQKQPIFKRG